VLVLLFVFPPRAWAGASRVHMSDQFDGMGEKARSVGGTIDPGIVLPVMLALGDEVD